MNYIVLEGISLYVFLILVIFLLLITLGSIICAILSDKRGFILKLLLIRKDDEIKKLIKENFVFRIKCGEFEFDEK